jgi:hypothetical protein
VFARALLIAAAAALAALALLPTAGRAAALKYHACDGKKYQLLHDSSQDPNVRLLRIKMRKAKADGYAPRCLVAEATAAEVRRSGTPKKVTVYGAAWSVGEFRCTYQTKADYQQAQCVHTGKDAATVRFRLSGPRRWTGLTAALEAE